MKTTPRRDRASLPHRRGLALCASIVAAAAFTDAATAIVHAQDAPFNAPLVWDYEPAASTTPGACATLTPAAPPAALATCTSPTKPVAPEPPSTGTLPALRVFPPSSAWAGKTSYDSLIMAIAAQFDIDAGLLHAVVQTESGYDASAVSAKGAIGLMQVLPSTGRRFGFTDLIDPIANLGAGAAYLKWLLNRFDGNLELALAAYNAGESAVERYGSTIPPYPETRSYVANVISRYKASHERAAPMSTPIASPVRSENDKNQYARAGPLSSIPPLRLLEKLGALLISAPPLQSNASRTAAAD